MQIAKIQTPNLAGTVSVYRFKLAKINYGAAVCGFFMGSCSVPPKAPNVKEENLIKADITVSDEIVYGPIM